MNPLHPSPQHKSHPAPALGKLDATEILIEQALGTFRDAQPQAGMEARLLAALEHRNTTQPTSLHERFFSRLRAPQLALGACIVMAIALLVSIPLHLRRYSIALISAQSSRTRATEEAAAGNAMPFLRTSGASREETFPETPSRTRFPHHASEPSLASAASRQSLAPLPSADNPDALALAELHAPSLAAPTLPLTPQERILLRVAHHPNPIQVAALNPVQRASLDDRQLAAFRHFFWKPLLPQPTIPPTLNGDTNAQ